MCSSCSAAAFGGPCTSVHASRSAPVSMLSVVVVIGRSLELGEAHGEPRGVAVERGKAVHHRRVVPGDDRGTGGRVAPQRRVAAVHVGEVAEYAERPLALEFVVVVDGVGRQHDRTVLAGHLEHQLAGRVTAHPHRRDTRRHLRAVLDQLDPLLGRGAAQLLDPVRVCVGGELGALGDRVGRPELELGAGHGHPRIGKQVEIANVVVVDVADHQQIDRGGVDPQTRQCIRWSAQAPTPHPFAPLGLKATVQHDRRRPGSVQRLEDPEVIAHVERPVGLAVGGPPVVGVAEGRLTLGVVHRQHAVGRRSLGHVTRRHGDHFVPRGVCTLPLPCRGRPRCSRASSPKAHSRSTVLR